MTRHTNFINVALFVCGMTATFSQALAADISARLGTSLPDSHPQTLGAQRFAELVEEKTDGDIEVQVFSNGILGNDVNMTSMVQAGTLDFTVPSTATLSSLNPDFSIISLPFQFDDEAHADAVLDSTVGEALLTSLEEKGLIGLGFWENGFRHITNSRRPIKTLEDLDGLKIRTMQNALYIDLFNNLDANAVPMPVNELFTALETHTVDGQENPYTVIDTKRFYEVQDYLSQTAHAYDALVLIASSNFLNTLDEQHRTAIQEAAREATLYQRTISRELNQALLTELNEKMQINEVSVSERQRMQQQLSSMLDQHLNVLNSSFVADFDNAINNNRHR